MKKIKSPVISRKKHEAELAELRRVHRQKEAELASILLQDKKDIQEVVSGLHKISLVRDYDRMRWRIVLDFSPDIVYALERGNDSRMLDYLVEAMAVRLRRELENLNIKRPADVGLGRRSVYEQTGRI